jgi:thiol-disulfide isomerase/thioredoxin
MRNLTGLSLIVLVFLSAACGPSSAPTLLQDVNGMPRTERAMPPISGRSLENMGWAMEGGKREILADHKGKVVVLDFWATYCPPCLKEIPHLVELQEKHRAAGLHIIGLNVGGEEDKPKIPEYVDKLKVQYALGYPDDELTQFLFAGNSAIPQTVIFDRKGKMYKKFVSYDDKVKIELDAAVEEALKLP